MGLLAAIVAASLRSVVVPFLMTRKKSLKSSYWVGWMFLRILRKAAGLSNWRSNH